MDSPWEDNLLERKTENDLRDLLKTMVAFANSVKPDGVATILIGERDDGTVQGVKNPKNIQDRVAREADQIYPPINWRSEAYERDALACVRVEIRFNGQTPHFGGPAWIREGNRTIKASEKAFQRLIDLRSSKTWRLAQWCNTMISIEGEQTDRRFGHPRWPGIREVFLREVNAEYITVEYNSSVYSEAMDDLRISWNNARNLPKVIVKGVVMGH